MSLKHWVACLLLALACTGCATRKALLDLAPQERGSVKLLPMRQNPSVRFASEGSRVAREFGGLLPILIAESIERSANLHSNIGTFEGQLVEQLMSSRLQAMGGDSQAGPTNLLTVSVHTVGLKEMERRQFAPFAHASARLVLPNGREIWSAAAQSSGTRPRAIEEWQDAALYRSAFNEVAEDLARQFLDGPLR